MSKRDYIYGIAPCLAALRANRRKIFKVFFNEKLLTEVPKREQLIQIVEESKAKNLTIKYKSRSILDRLSVARPHQNVVMYAGKLNYEKIGKRIIPSKKEEFWLALDQIHDPMNFGAIIRSGTFFGVDKIIATENSCCGLTPAVSKASSGAMESKIVHSTPSLEKLLKKLSNERWQIFGTSRPGEYPDDVTNMLVSSQNIKISKPTILVMGNEGFGLSPSVAKLCQSFITISPATQMLPIGLDSLNVSVATGILLHELLKDRCRDVIT